MANRLLEASDRNYWQPDDETLAALQDAADALEDQMEKAVSFLRNEFRGVRTGRASTGLVEGLKVEVGRCLLVGAGMGEQDFNIRSTSSAVNWTLSKRIASKSLQASAGDKSCCGSFFSLGLKR